MLMKALAGNQQKVEESVDAKLDKFFARAASAINENALVDGRRGALLGASERIDERDEYDVWQRALAQQCVAQWR